MTFRSILGIALAATVIACSAIFSPGQYTGDTHNDECVILVHGLCRSALSMKIIENDLKQSGYTVINVDYASTRKSITAIADEELAAAVSVGISRGNGRIHFVTHSLGAIVVRSYLQHHQLPSGSRIVMLAPPNQGSELVDWAQHHFPGLFRLAGPAAAQLGTKDHTLLPQLKPITPATGIIIGDNSWNPFFSTILPGSDDGKVTVERAELEEMGDFLITPCNHSTILLNRKARQQMIYFLQNGHFLHKEEQGVLQKTPKTQSRQSNTFLLPPGILRGENQAFLGIGR
jgi:triacylglycerol lipase